MVVKLSGSCTKREMLQLQYEDPDGYKDSRPLWAGGGGVGTLQLFRKGAGGRECVDTLKLSDALCVYRGEEEEPGVQTVQGHHGMPQLPVRARAEELPAGELEPRPARAAPPVLVRVAVADPYFKKRGMRPSYVMIKAGAFPDAEGNGGRQLHAFYPISSLQATGSPLVMQIEDSRTGPCLAASRPGLMMKNSTKKVRASPVSGCTPEKECHQRM